MLRLAIVVFLCAVSVCAQQAKQCATCHPSDVKTFEASAMGRSLSTVANQPDGRIHHEESDSTITIRHDGAGGMLQELRSHGLTAEYKIAYAVGAGKVGYSYLISIAPYLFQSPVSYYSQAGVWDVTPGYEPEHTLDFTHPIAEGCVFCHANKPNVKAGTDNAFNDPALTPISCERCHGSTAAHLKNPVPGSIVNPAKLTAAARDSVCEQCHLEGEARILNPGKHWEDFSAGEPLESVFSTYLSRVSASEGTKAVSQAEQLSLSRCARESGGRLWCGTCHNPHAQTSDRAKEIRATCLGCHQTLFTVQKHQAAEECVSCHMPRLRPSNVAHAAITDHLIALPSSAAANMNVRQPGTVGISAWRNPPAGLAERNLGLATFQIGAAKHDSNEVLRSYEILSHLPQRDPVVAATLGSILLEKGYGAVAVHLYQQAVAGEPHNARYEFLLGAAYAAQGNTAGAIEELRRSIALDPSSPDPYRKLSDVYSKAGEPALARQALKDYLKFMPQNLEFRRALE